jgi:ribosomal protein S18 acetylase RimI-like enzyme
MDISIRPATLQDLNTLAEHFPTGDSRHETYFAKQYMGIGVYLIAWLGQIPVGRGVLIWLDQCTEEFSKDSGLEVFLEDLYVTEEFRSQGVGSALVQEMERLTLERGLRCIGLGVNRDNFCARKLYYNLNYQESPSLPPHTKSEKRINKYGNEIESVETYLYLVKNL